MDTIKLTFAAVLGCLTVSTPGLSYTWQDILNVKEMPSPYEILKIRDDASESEVEASFERLEALFSPEHWAPNNQLGPLRPTSISKEEAGEVLKILRRARQELASRPKDESTTWGKNKAEYHFNFDQGSFDFELIGNTFDNEIKNANVVEREQQIYAVAAIQFNDPNAMKYAVTIGFDVNKLNYFLHPGVLSRAVERDEVDVVRVILSQKVVHDDQVVVTAATNGYLNILKMFYQNGFPLENLRVESGEHHGEAKFLDVGEIAKLNGRKDIQEWYRSIKDKSHQDL